MDDLPLILTALYYDTACIALGLYIEIINGVLWILDRIFPNDGRGDT